VRVQDNTCKMSDTIKKLIGRCYDTFSKGEQSKDSFGKARISGFSSSDITYSA